MPELLRTMFEHVETWSGIDKSLIGITYDDTEIVLLYNMPLRSHSATFQLVYNFITQEAALHVQYLGEARRRWEQIAVLAAASPELSGLILDAPIQLDLKAGIVNCGWKISTLKTLEMVEKYLRTMNDLSFQYDWNYTSFQEINSTVDSPKVVFERAYPHFSTRIKGTLEQDWRRIIAAM